VVPAGHSAGASQPPQQQQQQEALLRQALARLVQRSEFVGLLLEELRGVGLL
jgi:hypothetical protein